LYSISGLDISHGLVSLFLFQLVMEYCVGSASDILEGKLPSLTSFIVVNGKVVE